jgi:hypothetical protein
MSTALPSFLALGLLAAAYPAAAEEERRRIAVGLRANVLGGTGEPTNDVLGAGVQADLSLRDGWFVGAAIDVSPEFDVERIAGLVGLEQDPDVKVIDATGSSTVLVGWVGRSYPRRRIEWFWTAGAGLNAVEIDDASGPLADGGTFDVSGDAGTEMLIATSGGVRWQIGERWRSEVALRLQHHFADWSLQDSVSGATASVDDYTLKGIHLGFVYRFE